MEPEEAADSASGKKQVGLERVGGLVREVESLLEEANAPGAGCALLLDGRLILDHGTGYRELERREELEPGAQFYLYSLTKSLLACAVIDFSRQGRIGLDSPIQEYLPWLELEHPVTIRQLLDHTGGLPDYGVLNAYQEAVREHPQNPWTPQEFLANTLPKGLLFEPGKGWAYSNIGYLLLRLALEGIVGGSLQEVLRPVIFEPLGLRRTFVARDLKEAQVLTAGYSDFFNPAGALRDISRLYHPGWVSHGVVVSTPLEAAKMFDWLAIEETGTIQILKDQQSYRILPEVKHPLFRTPAYGLGLMVDPASEYGFMAGHGGGGPGYSAGALVLPDVEGRRISAAAIANRDRPDLGLKIAFTLAHGLAGELGMQP